MKKIIEIDMFKVIRNFFFWEGSNDALKCENCKDIMCKFKKPKYF